MNQKAVAAVVLGIGAFLLLTRRAGAEPLLTPTSGPHPAGVGGASGNATNPLTAIMGGVSDILTRIFPKTTSGGNVVTSTQGIAGPIGEPAPTVGYYAPEAPSIFDWSTLPQAPAQTIQSPAVYAAQISPGGWANVSNLDLAALAVSPSFVASEGISQPPLPEGSMIYVSGLESGSY